MGVLRQLCSGGSVRTYSAAAAPTTQCKAVHRCKLLVVGGGTGGCSVAWRFSRRLKDRDIIVLEPSQVHYYQPMFTLVAAGMKEFGHSKRPLHEVLPPTVTWCRDRAEDFDPGNSTVFTRCGDKIYYEYMVVAIGLENDYEQIPGLKQALDEPNSCVSTIYSPEHCCKTWRCARGWRGGHALFTFPAHGGKCSGAAQKIMYLADDYWRRRKYRHLTNITYNTGGAAMFGVPKYAHALARVARDRGIAVNLNAELMEVTHSGAVFRTGCETITLPYNFLHVTPPMCPPACLQQCAGLATERGYCDVDKHSLQHNKYPNVYGIGDCTSTPNTKTAAAVVLYLSAASQSYVLEKNLASTMAGKEPTAKYDGYGACPVLTSYNKGILAESVYDRKPIETFPWDQSKEHRLIYHLNTHYFPYLYWNKLVKGKWDGPSHLRKIINPLGR